MNRRDSIKKLAVASGALVALPSWATQWGIGDVAGHSSSFALTEEETLAAVADTIIPSGNSVGALSVAVDKFLQKLFDKCYNQEVQQNIKLQLNALESMAQNGHGKSFPSCDQGQREVLLLKFKASENKAEKSFFDLMKSETIRGFNTSKEVMLKHLQYKIAPGHYYGCVDVKA